MEDIKLNLEGIHLDMDTLIEKYDGKIHSCSNTDEIQQISLFCQHNRNDYRKVVLMDMINPTFAFAGLYPHIMKSFDISPELNKELANEVTTLGQKHLKEALEAVESYRVEHKEIKDDFCRCQYGSIMRSSHPCKIGCVKNK